MTDIIVQSRGISRRNLLGLGVVVAAAGFAGYRWAVSAPDYAGASLSVSQAHAGAVAGEIFLIDIRRPDEWRKTGIGEGALPLDMRRDDFTAALEELTGGDRAAPIALICARGVRSARLSNRLTEAGFTRIIDIPEGMLGSSAGPGWLETGLPVRAWPDTTG